MVVVVTVSLTVTTNYYFEYLARVGAPEVFGCAPTTLLNLGGQAAKDAVQSGAASAALEGARSE
jgi:hypothetical protein